MTDPADAAAAHGLGGLADLHPRERLGRYELEARIGEGAFAEVWRAVEIGTHGFRKRVALKILKPDGDDPESLDALLDEARLCGHLHHPSLVDVYGVTTDRGHTFVAMEWVDGISLDLLLDRFHTLELRFPPSAVIDLGIQLCNGLAHAHQATDHDGAPLDLVHRDLKPGNILLTWDGHAKITDWGIAKARTTNRSTQSGMLRGTPSYVAPEVWLGHRDFKPANDLFALGAILWEAAAGEILLQGDIPTLIGLATNGSVDEDVARLRMFSPELVPVVRELLQRKPELRLASALEARRGLQVAAQALPPGGGLPALMQMAAPILGSQSGPVGLSGRVRDLAERGDHAWSALLECAALHGLDVDADETLVSGSFSPAASPDDVPATRTLPLPPPPPPPPRLSVRPSLLGAGIAAVLFGAILAFSQWAGGQDPERPVVDASEGVVAAAPDAGESVPEAPSVESAGPDPEGVSELDPEAAPAAGAPEDSRRSKASPLIASEAQPRATSKPAAQPPPRPVAATPSTGCLVLQSSPPGAAVFVDGKATGVHAGTGTSARLDGPVGARTVGMGIGDAPQVSASVRVMGGEQVTVWCDLIGGAGCRVTAGGSCP